MLEVVARGRRPVGESAGKEELARQTAQIPRMSFTGLSCAGLYVLACCAASPWRPTCRPPGLIAALKAHEGLFQKLTRKRRRLMGKLVGRPPGGRFGAVQVPAGGGTQAQPQGYDRGGRGLVRGLADKLRGEADDYIAAKLDEIEARIDRKLDEIDRRLAQWRDQEIANRLRIIKITLGASVIVSFISVAYAWVAKHFFQ